MRNPEGTPKHLQRCAYYPHYRSEYSMLTPVERKALVAKIKELTIEEELVHVEENGKYIFSYFVRR